MSKLEPETIEARFSQLPLEWSIVGGTQLEIARKFDDFKQALDYVNKVGKIAETQNHHPDIALGYGKVEIVITTHSVGGLTNKDFDFAEAVEKIES